MRNSIFFLILKEKKFLAIKIKKKDMQIKHIIFKSKKKKVNCS
jgi:hypothetical protein